MNTQTKFQETAGINPITDQLINFVNQRPGLQFADYGDYKIFRKESREIANDLKDFHEILGLAFRFVGSHKLEYYLNDYLRHTSGRLSLVDGKLQYITGQYFPTEYRPAASRVLSSIIWNIIRATDETATGSDIRNFLKKKVSRRVYNYYFN